MVRMEGLEPSQAMLTTPSRWRVYQFHHIRLNLLPQLNWVRRLPALVQ